MHTFSLHVAHIKWKIFCICDNNNVIWCKFVFVKIYEETFALNWITFCALIFHHFKYIINSLLLYPFECWNIMLAQHFRFACEFRFDAIFRLYIRWFHFWNSIFVCVCGKTDLLGFSWWAYANAGETRHRISLPMESNLVFHRQNLLQMMNIHQLIC